MKSSKTSLGPAQLADSSARAGLHALAVALIAMGLFVVLVDLSMVDALLASLREGAHSRSTWIQLGMHVGVAAALWGGVWFGWKRLRKRRQLPQVRLGTVMVETLVVLPVALMLTFGLAQFAIINLAGIAMNVASFQATRTAWLWHPEGPDGGVNTRRGVGTARVEEMVRVQAAAVLTPVAPGGYMVDPDLSEQASQAMGIFMGSQSPIPFEDSGNAGRLIGQAILELDPDNPMVRGQHSFSGALDAAPNIVRTARKFAFAYHAVAHESPQIELTTDADGKEHLEVTLIYYHFCAFPLVNRIFGDEAVVGGRGGYYARMEKTLTRRAQLDVSSTWPQWETGEPERTYDLF
jgi:hypothetical protein